MFASLNAVQIRVSLDEIEPAIWRRLVVPIQWDLRQLHLAIQAAFNWWDDHLHEFHIGGLRYRNVSVLEEDLLADGPRVFDEQEVRLRDFLGTGIMFTYIYDFGDDWRHTIELEELRSFDHAPRQATCVDGARARPPEDVGGIPGYAHFLDVISHPKNPDYAETLQWCGGHFDPEWFDLAIVDKDVRNALKPNVRRRLHQPKPRKPKASS